MALRVRAYAAIAHASWPYLQRQRTADFHALFSTEIDRVEHATHLLLEVPARLSILAAHFIVAFAIAPGFTALAIAFGAALVWLMRHRLTASRRLGEAASEANMGVSREVTEFLQALKLTKAYGAETQHVQAFADAARRAEGADLAANRLQADTRFLLDCLVAVALAGFLWAGGKLGRAAAGRSAGADPGLPAPAADAAERAGTRPAIRPCLSRLQGRRGRDRSLRGGGRCAGVRR